MFTLVLQACDIPSNTKVRKVTGAVEYTLKREIKIYGEAKQEIKSENICYLVAGDSITAYNEHHPKSKFAIDFDTKQDLIQFLNTDGYTNFDDEEDHE